MWELGVQNSGVPGIHYRPQIETNMQYAEWN